MTTADAAQQLQLHPIVVARYCREGKIRATRIIRGRQGGEWDISPEAVAAFQRSRRSRSQVASELWMRRKRATTVPTRPHNPMAFFVPVDEDRSAEVRRLVMHSAIQGDPTARRIAASALTYWWNREAKEQTIVGRTPTELIASNGMRSPSVTA